MVDTKKDLLYKILGMIVANKKDNTKISYSVSENNEPFNDPDPDNAVELDFDFLSNHKVELDVYLETMINDKDLQKAVYSYRLLGGSEEKKVSMIINAKDKEQLTAVYMDVIYNA